MMRMIFGALCLVGALGLTAAPANAQASRTWVSGVGDDANPCSRTAPCKTYAGAISKTAVNGEINCIDPGGFGAVTITKSISIVCDYTEGGVLSAGTTGFIINVPAGGIVTLKGQDVECFITGINGIRILGIGATVHLHKIQVRNCRGGGSGIIVDPSSGTTDVNIADVYITDNGNSATTGGILVKPTASASVVLSVNRAQIETNAVGIRVDSSATTGTVRGGVSNSVVANNTGNGITAVSGATVSTLLIDRTSVVGNQNGLVVNGAVASLLATYDVVTANGTGLRVNGTGTLTSYKTNAVDNNTTTNGAFTNFIVPE